MTTLELPSPTQPQPLEWRRLPPMPPKRGERVGVSVPDASFDFSRALQYLKERHRVARKGWNGDDMHIRIQRPGFGAAFSEPYITLRTAQGAVVPWSPSQTDILAGDWVLV